jgi:predicted nucleic acid-binding protein
VSRRHLVDTDVLVEYLRGRPRAVSYLEGLTGELHVSAVTVAEMFAGAREDEEETLRDFLAAFEVEPVTERAAELAGRYRRAWGPSHGTGLADALIAAAVASSGCTLVTFNERHFPMLDAVEVPYER